MITEDYVSFETAKLLKDKGFDEPCNQTYVQHPAYEEPIVMINDASTNSKGVLGAVFPFYASAPTHQMALKWLREVHSILIGITSYDGQPERLCLEVFHNGERLLCVDSPKKYEELVEEAIKMSLKNLI